MRARQHSAHEERGRGAIGWQSLYFYLAFLRTTHKNAYTKARRRSSYWQELSSGPEAR